MSQVATVAPQAKVDAKFTDFEHTGPGTLAGRFLRSGWQPIQRSQDLPKGRAKPIRLMSEDYTLYRGESGNVFLVGQRCAHRGTQLSGGSGKRGCMPPVRWVKCTWYSSKLFSQHWKKLQGKLSIHDSTRSSPDSWKAGMCGKGGGSPSPRKANTRPRCSRTG